ncbi:phosphate signaling complex protein PhoU [Flavonifractor sp. An100]|uniref:phosphate signaling complex protein PhoU n=1 Tax=Flavonifractor sp. An100 TaxID=1965538 RepID=UPI000B369EDC|nr:phosphate signaling complex protein PhoU [Flavonifractor sp. An100]OUQ82319.1 phosphate transport system regulatory protein PhoU [Flavonifractor sp. An100]
MRNTFNEQLEQLNVELIKMGALCEEAISAATKAYLEADRELGQRACQLEQEIDHKERDIEGQCMKLLLRQQPVARDLRSVSAAMRMISDMERIGDQASDIAEIARDIQSNQLASQVPMEEMARQAISMVTDSVDAFVRGDLALAHSVIVQDDILDHLFLQVREELIGLIASGKNGSVCLDMLMIAKYFERIGDHACNIAQWVEYAITGQYEDD